MRVGFGGPASEGRQVRLRSAAAAGEVTAGKRHRASSGSWGSTHVPSS